MIGSQARGQAAFGSVVPTGVEFALWHLQRLFYNVGLNVRVERGVRRFDMDDFVLFGSTVLWLHGIRDEIGDVDVFVTRGMWGRIVSLGKLVATVETPRAGDPPYLAVGVHPPIHVFYEWTERDAEWLTVEECFESAEIVGGWPCIPVEMVRKHKTLAHSHNLGSEAHEKHARDLALIDEYLR